MSPTPIKAKIDTGARTSALHAFRLEITSNSNGRRARFQLQPVQRSRWGTVSVEAEIVEFRKIRSSNGRVERRPVVTTPIQIGDDTYDIAVTLTSRDEMGFRLLLGRAAIRGRYLVDPGRSFLVPLIDEWQEATT